MNGDTAKLGNTSAAFGLAAAIVALFNTALACTKDAYHPLNTFMNHVAGHNWTTQALADIILFVVMGLIFSGVHVSEKMKSDRLISFLVAAVVIAGVGLFAWYALY
jgi:uncharacterized membrane protein SirB2